MNTSKEIDDAARQLDITLGQAINVCQDLYAIDQKRFWHKEHQADFKRDVYAVADLIRAMRKEYCTADKVELNTAAKQVHDQNYAKVQEEMQAKLKAQKESLTIPIDKLKASVEFLKHTVNQTKGDEWV